MNIFKRKRKVVDKPDTEAALFLYFLDGPGVDRHGETLDPGPRRDAAEYRWCGQRVRAEDLVPGDKIQFHKTVGKTKRYPHNEELDAQRTGWAMSCNYTCEVGVVEVQNKTVLVTPIYMGEHDTPLVFIFHRRHPVTLVSHHRKN